MSNWEFLEGTLFNTVTTTTQQKIARLSVGQIKNQGYYTRPRPPEIKIPLFKRGLRKLSCVVLLMWTSLYFLLLPHIFPVVIFPISAAAAARADETRGNFRVATRNKKPLCSAPMAQELRSESRLFPTFLGPF